MSKFSEWKKHKDPVVRLLGSIDETLKRMEGKMASKEELNTALDGLVGKVAEAFAEQNKAFARLQAKIDALGGGVAEDLTAELAKVTDLTTKVAEAIADSQSETPDAPVEPPTV